MNRRDFVSASVLAGAAPMVGLASGSGQGIDNGQQYLEWIHYHQAPGEKRQVLGDYLRDVLIPALNRIGIGPVGVFTVQYGQTAPSLYVLIPHDTLESVITAGTRLLDDDTYRKDVSAYMDVPIGDPAYIRMEKSLMLAFKDLPKVEPPAKEEGVSRLYELRTYESHSEKAAKKKIEMFNEGGEIAIFRESGMNPVFFGETLFGPKMPNLTYMLSFRDMAERDAAWSTFVNSPAWKELSAKDEYADTVSNISDVLLRATRYSQI